MKWWYLAVRNTLRNRRRSMMTVLTLVIGAMALNLFGGFVNTVFRGIETEIVQRSGHIHLYQQGYFEYGAGRPTDYDLDDYEQVMALLSADPVLSSLIHVMTPVLNLSGIAGNYADNSSQTFVGMGVISADMERMRRWDGYQLGVEGSERIVPSNHDAGVIGQGLARVLGLCEHFELGQCQPAQQMTDTAAVVDAEIVDMAAMEAGELPASSHATLDLLAATSAGAPNVIRIDIQAVEQQPQKAVDDRYIGMSLSLAQQLLYGPDEHAATGIIIQLHDSQDLERVVTHLTALVEQHGLTLDIKSLMEFNSSYPRITAMFSTIFTFIAIVIGIVVLFTITNNLSMSVMERYQEIGTMRAMGVDGVQVRTQFVLEGMVLGLVGATIGFVVAGVTVVVLNNIGLTWTPPSSSGARAFVLQLFANVAMPVGIWVGLIVMSVIAAWLPARRASQLSIVEALRHV